MRLFSAFCTAASLPDCTSWRHSARVSLSVWGHVWRGNTGELAAVCAYAPQLRDQVQAVPCPGTVRSLPPSTHMQQLSFGAAPASLAAGAQQCSTTHRTPKCARQLYRPRSHLEQQALQQQGGSVRLAAHPSLEGLGILGCGGRCPRAAVLAALGGGCRLENAPVLLPSHLEALAQQLQPRVEGVAVEQIKPGCKHKRTVR